MAAFTVSASLLILIAALLRALVEAHVEAEERATILAHEMRHRVGNVLGLVQAISRQTARGVRTVEEHQTLFGARLMALGQAQALVAKNPEFPPDLEELLDRVLEPFGKDRFTLLGPRIGVRHDLGTSLALLIHELGINAMKHGALSVPEGRVAISWTSAINQVQLEWRESDGPPVAAPSRNGFGSRLLKTTFAPEQGEVSTEFKPGGLRCVVRFPATAQRAAPNQADLRHEQAVSA